MTKRPGRFPAFVFAALDSSTGQRSLLTCICAPWHPWSPHMFDTTPTLDCNGRALVLDRPRVMGIVNVTPDSFSDGGAHDTLEAAVAHGAAAGGGGRRHPRHRRRIDAAWRGRRVARRGTASRDPGDRAPRPGDLAADQHRHLQARGDACRGRRRRRHDQRRLCAAPRRRAGRRGRARRAGGADAHAGRAALDAGRRRSTTTSSPRCTASSPSASSPRRWPASPRRRSWSIPGFGFGKNREHNLTLLAQLERFGELGVPLLAGLSRKKTIGELTGRDDTARSRVRLGRRAPDRRATRGEAGARARRGRHRRCAQGLECGGGVAAAAKAKSASASFKWPDDE